MTECPKDFVRISKEHYASLLDDQRVLDALRAAGVDNWEGFAEAVGDDDEDDPLDPDRLREDRDERRRLEKETP